MSNETKKWKLGRLAREFNVSIERIIEVLEKEGYKGYSPNPNEKVEAEAVRKLARHFGMDKKFRSQLEEIKHKEDEDQKKESISLQDIKQITEEEEGNKPTIFIHDTTSGTDIAIDKEAIELEKVQTKKSQETEVIKTPTEKHIGLKIVGKIDLNKIDQPSKKKKKTKTEAVEEKTELQTDQPQTENQKTKEEQPKSHTEKATEVIEQVDNILKQIGLEEAEKKDTKLEQKEQKEQKTEQETEAQVETEQAEQGEKTVKTEEPKLKIIGKIDLDKIEKKEKAKREKKNKREKETRQKRDKRRRREEGERKADKGKDRRRQRRIEKVDIEKEAKKIKTKQTKKRIQREVIIDQKEIEKSFKETMQQAHAKPGKSIAKERQKKKKLKEQKKLQEEQQQQQSKTLTITEFLTLRQLATLMGVDEIELMQKALSLGIAATVNYPLEADEIELLASEYGFEVEFVDIVTLEELEAQVEDKDEDLVPRPPIVTVMGHVDHGKTSLLDYIRKTNVVAGEAGGITQHIGAYHITLDDGRKITFIDTPGHEAFTAMRARGAKVTDIAVIVIAADDGVRPQTEEALDHAKAAGVPIIFALNKVDKDTADPEKIRNQLAQRGYLVSSWGGEYFDVEISAKTGYNIDELLETILLVAEDLNLRANPNRPAVGTVLEASIEKGRGPVANILVKTGTLRKGDIILAGSHYGRVRAMFNERMKKINEAGPSIPAQILGLDGTPEPGEPFIVMESEKEAKQKAQQRAQIKRVIERRSRKILTLEEISRRLKLGDFNEINIIIRADVQGTADALAEQLEKLSTDEVQVNIIRKAVGQISESDVMLAHVSKAIIIGFNVRPSAQARKRAEEKEVEIRTYSIIYQAIDDVKDAIKGILKPIIKEEYLGTAKVLKTFKIKGVGTVAGCQIEQGKITRDASIRVIRNGIVIYEGEIASLKRYQEDVQEVRAPQECGLAIKNFNDIKKDDQIEAFKKIEIKREL